MHPKPCCFLSVISFFASLGGYAQRISRNDYLVLNSTKEQYSYQNQLGQVVIPPGKYGICYTDTFRTYAIVLKDKVGFVTIDRQENVLYTVLPFDNGPDEPSGGLFRITRNNKIGYASAKTGQVVIKPQFDCAWPFKRGLARVSMNCTVQSDGEHSFWLSENWYYIDKNGKKISSSQKSESNIRK